MVKSARSVQIFGFMKMKLPYLYHILFYCIWQMWYLGGMVVWDQSISWSSGQEHLDTSKIQMTAANNTFICCTSFICTVPEKNYTSWRVTVKLLLPFCWSDFKYSTKQLTSVLEKVLVQISGLDSMFSTQWKTVGPPYCLQIATALLIG